MKISLDKKSLAKRVYWNKQYKNVRLKRPLKVNINLNLALAEIDKHLKKYLPVNKNFRFIEIGCAPGRWLHYFSKNFKYQVDGMEYALSGVKLTKQNLKLLNIKGNIYYQDILQSSLPPQSYNVVFSAGLIEHFADPDKVIENHLYLLKKEGYLILSIPHLQGINYFFRNWLDQKSIARHNLQIMNLDYFQKIAKKYDLDTVFLSYIGRINVCLFGGNSLIAKTESAIQLIPTLIYFLLGRRFFIKDGKKTSPYIISIFRLRHPFDDKR